MFAGKDPTIPLVLLEDSAALFGLIVALAAVGLSWWSKSVVPDAVGSMVIGVLLCGVGVALGRDTRSLLIGEGVTPEVRAELLELANGTEGVERVTQLLTLHLGPQTVLAALKVKFRPGMLVDESEQVVDDLEERIRARLPQMKRIFVEPDGDFDERDSTTGGE
jgi:divalent metal cation (Fe/Co/Zn/Cd) transporter